MIIDKKYILIFLAVLVFLWRLCVYPKLKEKETKNLEFFDALIHLLLIGSGFYILDYKIEKNQLNYYKIPADF
jgi:hypothetical protein